MSDEKPTEYVEYFASKAHEDRLAAAFARTQEKLTTVGLAQGPLEAISEAQGAAAAVSHFYSYTGLKQQGAAYFRGLADQIEKG